MPKLPAPLRKKL
ncbi:putative transcription regulator domain protein, partial [Escherichia coli FRIK523]